MKKLILGLTTATLVATAVGVAAPANAAQGGFTMDGGPADKTMMHSWCKVGRAELDQSGAEAACYSTGIGYFGCDGVVSEINRQHSANPRANGYWAEKYYFEKTPDTTVKLRSGTW